MLLRRFEKLLDPYPDEPMAAPPRGFFPFVWPCTTGARPAIAWLIVFTAACGVFEAVLFSMLGRIVDWLSSVEPSQLWARQRGALALLAAIVVASPLLIALQTIVKHQALAGNLPMRLRWNFHRLMLGQSMAFYQDEFAGRITACLLYTSPSPRD